MAEGFPDNSGEQVASLFPLVDPGLSERLAQRHPSSANEQRMMSLLGQGANSELLTAGIEQTVRIGNRQLPEREDFLSEVQLQNAVVTNLSLVAHGLVYANRDVYGNAAIAIPKVESNGKSIVELLTRRYPGKLYNPRITLGPIPNSYQTAARRQTPDHPVRDMRLALVTIDQRASGKPPVPKTVRVVVAAGRSEARNGSHPVDIYPRGAALGAREWQAQIAAGVALAAQLEGEAVSWPLRGGHPGH